jgi:PhnO protein
MAIEFRKADISMADAVYGLIRQLEHEPPYEQFLSQFSKKVQDSDYEIWVAVDEVTVIAFAELLFMQFLHKQNKWAKLVAFCVDAGYRNKQIGSDFLHFLEKRCTDQQCECLELISNIRRVHAHRFYERHGFTEYSKMYIKRFP